MRQMLMGSDPEHFVLQGGKVVAAHTLGVPPQKHKEALPGGYMYRDGFAVEFAPFADECRAMFSNSLMALYSDGLMRLNGMGEDEFYSTPPQELPITFSMEPLHAFGKEEFKELMESCPEDLKQFGCSPAYDAYEDGKPIRVRVRPSEWPYRTTGGHMHYTLWQGDNGTYSGPIECAVVLPELAEAVEKGKDVVARKLLSPLVRRLDACVGLAYTALFPQEQEQQRIRRRVYGKAGEFRLQVYKRDEDGKPTVWGVEYRTLGPRLMLSSLTVGLFYGLMREVCENTVDFSLLTPEKEKEVLECIQSADSSRALTLWGELFPNGVVDFMKTSLTSRVDYLLLSKDIMERVLTTPELALSFSAHTLPWEQQDAHTGWREWMHRNGLPCEVPTTRDIPKACAWCYNYILPPDGMEGEYLSTERDGWVRGWYHLKCFTQISNRRPDRYRKLEAA